MVFSSYVWPTLPSYASDAFTPINVRLFWSLEAELWQMMHIVTLSTRVLPC
ncbi:MAG: hypothetical protein IPF50_17435 [Proteobacteria bacterium]|nr:hypothetical protein [Pseudomonadota bacterium]